MSTKRACEVKVVDHFRNQPPILAPLILLVVVSAVVGVSDFDLTLQHEFWSPETGWRLADSRVVTFLYRYGTWPALLVGGAGALTWISSWVTGRWQRLRPLSLFLVLLLVLGPGIVINAMFKEHFRRPRPTQVTEFGGNQPFRPVGEMGSADEGKSFPSGHASMGFYWLGLFIYFWNRKRRLAWTWGGFALLHGVVMGVGRMAQGGHWFTDVLWSAGFVYLSGWVLRCLPFCHPATAEKQIIPEAQSSAGALPMHHHFR